jgi:hypothetical protein
MSNIKCCVCGAVPEAGAYGMVPADEAFDRWTTGGLRGGWIYYSCPKPECGDTLDRAINESRIIEYLESQGVERIVEA